jgi:hypothetical protein
MIKLAGAILVVLCSSQAVAGTATDFGVRLVPTESGGRALVPVQVAAGLRHQPVEAVLPLPAASFSLSNAAAIAARMGRVTSTHRSPARNRIVGGVRNSYHLSGRALDVVPRSGVGHRQIEAALLNAGYRLRESLNEGDHSHFAFDFGSGPRFMISRAVAPQPAVAPVTSAIGTTWKVVYAPTARSR